MNIDTLRQRLEADKAKLPALEQRPCCNLCGERLPLYVVYARGWSDGEPLPNVDSAIVSVSPGRKGTWLVGTWLGDYGRMGDNRFCRLECAYEWAVVMTDSIDRPEIALERNQDESTNAARADRSKTPT